MGQAHSILAFALIAILYVVIGIMAARGTICIFRKMLAPKSEQVLYAVFLILVAAYYLAFVAYFGATRAWQLEGAVVAAFVAISLLGVRLPFALIVGFSLHGLWDALHEFQAHGGYSAVQAGQLTAIPLAYGFFCAAFDFYVAAYFYRRRAEWSASWKAVPQ
jgi:hypothetical protein